MRQGEIYLVNFEPSVGHEYRKVRPALVIASQLATSSSLVTVLPISSRLERFQEPDVCVEKDRKNRLASDSIIMVRHISSFDKKRFIRKIGEVNSTVLRKVRGYLRKHFQL
jgi:mRNA interferase MazF